VREEDFQLNQLGLSNKLIGDLLRILLEPIYHRDECVSDFVDCWLMCTFWCHSPLHDLPAIGRGLSGI
jgi:hypothetical protein